MSWSSRWVSMASLNSSIQNSTNIFIVILVLHPFLCPVSSFNQPQSANSPWGLLFEEKNRIGSTPPTCHNKCNHCHPCMAVQVPSLLNLASNDAKEGFFVQGNSYSNYKPLSWKCHCGGHFFNP